MNTKGNLFLSLFQEITLFNVVYFQIILFLGILVISLAIIPRIRPLSLKLSFTDSPDHRSSQTGIIRSFGGFAFYISYILVLFFIQPIDSHYVSLTLLSSISVLSFLSLKKTKRASFTKINNIV
tara:strand:- start:704 stop:1075 length:372 start_codon:yes stop_codon:yes gene_type:complete